MFDITRSFDFPILDWIADRLWCPALDAVMPVITHLGDGGILWIALAVLLLCLPKYRQTGLATGIALAIGLLICNLWLKPWIGRLRPFDYAEQCFGRVIPLLINAPRDFSFPSGHTIAGFESATVLLLRHRKIGIPVAVLAVLIAFSRLYLYVHYPTDLLSSIVLGIGIGFAANFIVNRSCALYQQKVR